MIKEYRVEMSRSSQGKWCWARRPNLSDYRKHETRREAEEWLEQVAKAWQEYGARPTTDFDIFDNFRITSREVTEWTVEE